MRQYRGKYPKLAKLALGESMVIAKPKATSLATHRQTVGNVVANLNRTRDVQWLRWHVTNHVTGTILVTRTLTVDQAMAALGSLRV